MPKIILAFVSAGLTILAMEALLRFAEGSPLRTVGGVVLWSSRAPRSDRSDIERAAHNPTAFTIIGLGDSIMYGVSEPKEKTYLEQARRVLAQGSKRTVEILNLAVPGYNTVQENAAYEEVGGELKPNIVLVHFYADDIHQYVSDGSYVYDTGEMRTENRVADSSFAARLSDFLLAHSRVYDHLYAQALRSGASPTVLRNSPDDGARMCSALTQIAERARRAGGRLVVLSSPALDGPLPPPNDLPGALRQCASPRGIEVIDLTEWLGGAGAEGIALDNCHFNEEGHRRVGEGLANYLLTHDLRE